MGVIYGALPPTKTLAVPWVGVEMKWTGWDGSEWMLSDPSDGTVMLPGVRGMAMPPIIHHRAVHASVPGARWRGLVVDSREVFWPLQVYSDLGSAAWLDKDAAFWRTMDPARTGKWEVTLPDGRVRALTLRFVNDGDGVFDTDPVLVGWRNYGITFSADQPFWEGEEISGTWFQGSSQPFFGGTDPKTGKTVNFTISPGNTLTKASMINPGDVDVYLKWRIYGPVTAAVVGINGRNITLPFDIGAGEVVEIDSDPRAQTAMKGSAGGALTTDWTYKLGDIDFAPLPPGNKTTLSVSVTGSGSISASFMPRYYRAW
ncbi:MAG TPA: hypothetical protein VLJ40_10185 [Arthrobacter sp.]|nr:hypothetical protein [Arthrobacter sp.]